MEINRGPAKEIQYIKKLKNHFSQSWTRRFKNKVFNKSNKTYSRSDLVKILDHQNSDYAYKFIDKLIEANVLEHAGTRETASSPTEVFTYKGNKELLKAFQNTEYYDEHRGLFIDTLEKAEGKELI